MTTTATFEQSRELLGSPKLSREQVETLARNGRLAGPLPEPSGFADGVPFWTRQSIGELTSAMLIRSGFSDPTRYRVRVVGVVT